MAPCDGELGAQLARIDEPLAALLALFHDRIHDDLVKGQLFERLHHDLSRYRDDFIYNYVTKRTFTDPIGLFDRVDGLIREPLSDGISWDDLNHAKSVSSRNPWRARCGTGRFFGGRYARKASWSRRAKSMSLRE